MKIFEKMLKQAYQIANYLVQVAFKNLMNHEIRMSYYLSHFAALFIVTEAKISIVESFFLIKKFSPKFVTKILI